MPNFFWLQQAGGADPWIESLSEHREKLISERRPAFVTVLDASSVPDEASWGREDYAKMRYSGPLYFDWDAQDISDTIEGLHKFVEHLKENGVNLDCLRYYATGGRGFHLEIPQAVFLTKVPKDGTKALPYIYREMAMDMVVDTMDMRIYTGRKGRMWRTCGVERTKEDPETHRRIPQGTYKVPLTLDEALSVTPETYAQWCKAPRPEPTRATPELSTHLASLFVKCQQKIDNAVSKASKTSKDVEQLARFKGKTPPSIEKIMRGEGLAPGTGFQKISMQLAIAANALGMERDKFIEACDGLCKNHVGDSSRYGSPRKRREELGRMWDYTHNNPCYSYSIGGIKSLFAFDVATDDLDGMGASVGELVEEGDEVSEEDKLERAAAGKTLYEGVQLSVEGIFRKTSEGSRKISNIGFSNAVSLREAVPDGGEHNALLGLVAEVYSNEKSCGRHTLSDKAFMSRNSLATEVSRFGGIFSGTDTQAGVVKLILNSNAEKRQDVIYALHKEGLDVVQNPKVKGTIKREVVWVAPDKVVATSTDVQYTYQPAVAKDAVFKADVHRCAPMTNTPENIEWLKAVFSMNTPTVLAQMFGWFVSTFHKQFYHEAFNQFPLLHPTGPAGSGKTQTSLLLARLNYMAVEPKMMSCGTVTTAFALKAAFTGSCSIPLILDEYKPTEMGPVRSDFLMQVFRLAYNQGKGASGAMGNSSATATFRDITEYSFSSPICYLAEAQEMQTAIVQRSLPVAFSNGEHARFTEPWARATAEPEKMAQLGRLLLTASFNETPESRKAALTPIRDMLRKAFPPAVHDRQVYNLAIVLEGLNFLGSTLELVFGDALKSDIERLKAAIHEHKADINCSAQSEAAKMFNDMSLISRSDITDPEMTIREGYDYIVKDGYMEVLMRECFVKYYGWARRKGFTPYYASPEAFVKAMGTFPPILDKACVDSPLRTNGQSRIFRFSLERLMAEGVELFKTK